MPSLHDRTSRPFALKDNTSFGRMSQIMIILHLRRRSCCLIYSYVQWWGVHRRIQGYRKGTGGVQEGYRKGTGGVQLGLGYNESS